MAIRGSWRDRPKDLPAHVGWKPKKRAGEPKRVVVETPSGKTEVYEGGRVRKISPTGEVTVSKIPSESAEKYISEVKEQKSKGEKLIAGYEDPARQQSIVFEKPLTEKEFRERTQRYAPEYTTGGTYVDEYGRPVSFDPRMYAEIGSKQVIRGIEKPETMPMGVHYVERRTILKTAIEKAKEYEKTTSTLLFGHPPEFVEIGGKKYKYEEGMRVKLGEQLYLVPPQRIQAFNIQKTMDYVYTEKPTGTTKPALYKYSPIKEFAW